MSRPAKIIVIGFGVAVAVLVLPLCIGVWVPDTLSGASHTIAVARLTDGSELRIVQYWNHVDFYSTELRHTLPDGLRQTWVLDGDDRKRWHIVMSVDEQNHTVSIPHEGPNLKTIKW